MRLPLLVLVGCSSASPSPQSSAQSTTPQGVIANVTRSCADAARGLEGATKGVRAPESSVFDALLKRCHSDHWPTTAIECFATMREGDLGACSRDLAERAREAMFAVLGGGEHDRAGIAVARARLEILDVGVPQCDRFVAAVSKVLDCEQMPIDARVSLGNETAQFWSLPTERLGEADLQRISGVCGESLATLQREVAAFGCTP